MATRLRHGLHGSDGYHVWKGMNQRCYNSNNPRYDSYGGRGIEVCERWRHSFPNFIADMGPRPTLRHSIERVDNHGNYEPGNCVWALPAVQSRNTRRNINITWDGRTQCLSDWAKELGMEWVVLYSRVCVYGWTIERAFTHPLGLREGAVAGEANGSVKLTETDVLAIRADQRAQKVIAAEYGIAQTQVSRIKRRESWKHI